MVGLILNFERPRPVTGWAEYGETSSGRIIESSTVGRALLPLATSSSPAAASAPPRRPHAPVRCQGPGPPLNCTCKPNSLIRERMQDVAREQGVPHEPDRPDNIHRSEHGRVPQGAALIPNPFNKISGLSACRHGTSSRAS